MAKVEIPPLGPCMRSVCGRKREECERSYMKTASQEELARMFGVEHGLLRRVFLRRGESKQLTKEQIAGLLLNKELVDSKEEGLKETDIILKNGIGDAKFFKIEGTERYKLKYSLDLGNYRWPTY